MNKKKILSVLLAGCLMVGCMGSAYADRLSINYSDADEIMDYMQEVTPDDEYDMYVHLTSEPMVFSVLVPTVLPIHVSKEGEVKVATDGEIINNSVAAVKISNVGIYQYNNNWTFADWVDENDLSNEKVGANIIAMSINGAGAKIRDDGHYGKCDISNNIIPADSSMPFEYDVHISPLDERFDEECIMSVCITMDWDRA